MGSIPSRQLILQFLPKEKKKKRRAIAEVERVANVMAKLDLSPSST